MPERGRAALVALVLALVAGLGVLAWVALVGGTRSEAVTARGELEPIEARRAQPTALERPADEGVDAAAESVDAADARVGLAAEVPEAELAWRGVVVDAATGAGVDGAEVELAAGERSRAATTDAEGRFELAWPSAVPARLALRHPRYVDAAATRVDLGAEGRFALERSAALRGYVQPGGLAGVVASWLVSASSERYWEAREVPIGADGRFAFEDLTPGEYLLAARVEGHAVAPEAGLRLDAGQELELVLRARAGTRLVGRVISKPGDRPLGGVRVTAGLENDDLPREWRRAMTLETESGPDGRFELVGLGPGSWRLRATDERGATASRDVEVAASGERLEVELWMPGSAGLGGRVVDAAGQGVAGCEVAAFGRSNRAGDFVVGRGPAQARTDAQGAFWIEDVEPGSDVHVAAREPAAEGERPRRFAVERVAELAAGAQRGDLALTLVSTRALAGRVLSDDDGTPIAGARVRAFVRLDTRTTSSLSAESDAEGRFALDGLPGEGGYVDADADGWRRGGAAWTVDGGEVELRLERAYTLEGYAVDAQGLAVVGVPITTQPVAPEGDERAARRQRQSTATDENGRFRFEDLRPGAWQVRGGSYAWSVVGEEWRGVELPQLAPLELVFERNGRPTRATIEGEVVLADGGAPTGLELEGLRGGVLSVERGRFRVTGVTPTRQQLTVRADGHAGVTLEAFDLAPGGLYDVGRVELAPATYLSVRVREQGGGDLSGARVRLVPLPVDEGGAGPEARVLRLDSRRRGRYETGDATRHTWRLVVDRDGYGHHARRLEILAQDRQSVTVELERAP